MGAFRLITEGLNVAPLVAEIEAQPELWNQHRLRKDTPGSPHAEMDDIWLRHNAYDRILADREAGNGEHVPVWYPAWPKLPAARPIIFGLMALVEAEMLCGVLITRVPPGGRILPHVDRGWHARYTDRLYVALKSPVDSYFCCRGDDQRTEAITPRVGDVHLFDNSRLHWVDNASDDEKMTMIISLRTDRFGRV
jgi:hypothetical protein